MTMTKTVCPGSPANRRHREDRSAGGIPTFNNAETVGSVVKASRRHKQGVSHASVLVLNADAGSQDGTPETIKHALEPDLSTAFIQHLEGGVFSGPISLQAPSESGVPGREHAFERSS